jgi:hypothetical protein
MEIKWNIENKNGHWRNFQRTEAWTIQQPMEFPGGKMVIVVMVIPRCSRQLQIYNDTF